MKILVKKGYFYAVLFHILDHTFASTIGTHEPLSPGTNVELLHECRS